MNIQDLSDDELALQIEAKEALCNKIYYVLVTRIETTRDITPKMQSLIDGTQYGQTSAEIDSEIESMRNISKGSSFSTTQTPDSFITHENMAYVYLKTKYQLSDLQNELLKRKNKKLVENEKSLVRVNKELEEKNIHLEAVQHRMQQLVDQFTHSLGNVIFPGTIYQVAERLKKIPECRKDVLLLHEAYHSEIIIKLQSELLRHRYANTNPESFRMLIRGCRRNENSADKIKSIEDILNYAASRVTARFLNQHYAGLNTIRDKITANKDIDIDTLRHKFEDDILLNKSLTPVAWINQNLRPINITNISPLWKKVYILSDSYAEALLFGYISEILFNAFKYADQDENEFLALSFDENTINDKIYLSCSWENPVKDKSTSTLGTQKGLESIQEDLKQLNDTENIEESLLVSQINNKFKVSLYFKKDLLVNESPVLKIKRKVNVE